jgi:hypothetical protein
MDTFSAHDGHLLAEMERFDGYEQIDRKRDPQNTMAKSSTPNRSTFLGLTFPTAVPNSPKEGLDTKKNAATGASAASVRAIASQIITFYFRAPVKAFFRTRVE